MQQGGPQSMQSPSPGGFSMPGTQFMPPGVFAQPQPGAQFMAPGAYSQPQAQTQMQMPGQFAQPAGFPQMQAFPQPAQAFPQSMMPGVQAMPPAMQAYPQPQAQAAPVQPVACPAYVPPPPGATSAGQAAQGAPQTAAQAASQRLTAVARSLEQAIPGYQVIFSIIDELVNSQKLSPTDTLLLRLKDAAFHHFAALGAIRRLLCGEAAQGPLLAMAVSLNNLSRTHTELRPLLERLIMSTPAEQRASLNSLGQALSAADYLLNQAASSVQIMVGPQAWESARSISAGAVTQGVPSGSVESP